MVVKYVCLSCYSLRGVKTVCKKSFRARMSASDTVALFVQLSMGSVRNTVCVPSSKFLPVSVLFVGLARAPNNCVAVIRGASCLTPRLVTTRQKPGPSPQVYPERPCRTV